ncbi:arylsulfatase regulator [Pseudomonas amygdali pv. morsprunorum]|nr:MULTISPECIES: arylsulfatase regulator [Pseudomonas syringae group]MDT3227724.1 arylsulfatase regulator [Pseudomonas amygdali pv. morsprunorum]MDT3244437.1 arylsulfatase regulator [Pseudomonas amygdali pv. morsprunorum]
MTLLNYFQPLGQQYRTLSSGKKMLDLSAEQHQLAKVVHDYASRFPSTESGDSQLLQGCYDYMMAFKQVLDSSSKVQMDYICLQYPGLFRFAKMMELLAQGIADGVIQVPKEHST